MIIALVGPSVCWPQTPVNASPQQGTALLKNGNLIEGRITRAGDYFYVLVPNGEIRLKASDIEFVCRDIEEVYHRKKAAINTERVEDHLRLAQWCLDKRLIGHAAAELADAWDIEPNHPAIDFLNRRLKVAMEPAQRPASSTEETAPIPSMEELNKMARLLPPDSVATFTETIQPLLANNCMTSGCHGTGNNSPFDLQRSGHRKLPSRQTTLRNLQATLEWVDQDNPDSSRLLTALRQPHGGAKKPIISRYQQDQYQKIYQWVHSVTGHPLGSEVLASENRPGDTPTTADRSGGDENQAAASKLPLAIDPQNPFARSASGESNVKLAMYQEDIPTENSVPEGSPRSQSGAVGHLKRGAVLKHFVPADPFDPEIFNRRYHESKK